MRSDIVRTFARLAIGAAALLAASTNATAQSIQVIAPGAGAGPGVILISGASGTARYLDFANAVAALGYTAVLVSGKDIANQHGASAENMTKVFAAVQADPRVRPGKVVVVGFSLGGGGALLHAASRPEAVAAVAAYYPSVTRLPSISEAARRVAVPTLILAGERDRYGNCCLIESIREFEAAARSAGTNVSLVTYPEAGHGFNLNARNYRADSAADAWARVRDLLARHLPR